MYTKEDLKEYLKAMGLTGKETILVHSSMKSIGEVEGRADTVLDALIEYFKDGLLLLPTHTWKNINEDNPVYDPAVTPSCVGILTNLFLKRDGVIRSLHPTHSMAGIGVSAKEYLAGEEYNNTPCTPGGCYDRLKDCGGKILLIGVGNERNTYIHSVEEVLPTHTWKNINEDNPVYDPAVTPSCVGILTNLFLKRDGVIRSLHPTHSMAGIGVSAKEYLAGEEYNNTPCTPGGCYDRLKDCGGKILLIGVGNERNTYIHSVEEVLNIPNRLSDKPMKLQIIMPDKSIKTVYVRKHYNAIQPHISEDFVKLDQALLECNAMTRVKFADADSLLCDAGQIFKVVRHILSPAPECIVTSPIEKSQWQDFTD